ncbi:MAG: T9SS type A sorting domain-containing protein [candidate division Zixibacteria bacterium]|nr:T9SS type A sorting domain-containing protein [candidate division Zixibacteria bacterium]
MKKNVISFLVVSVLFLGFVTSVQADIIPTNHVNFFRGDVTFNGELSPVGTIVDAYDPDNVHCGTYTVGVDNYVVPDSVGIYGYMAVYGDDSHSSGVDEGAVTNDAISFKVMDRPATIVSGDSIWHDLSFNITNLSALADIDIDLVDPPNNESAPSCDESGCDTVRFMIGVENTGNGNDFYGVDVTSAKGWDIIPFDTIIYAGTDSVQHVYNQPGNTAYVFFDVIVPKWPGEEPDTLFYDVFSRLDETVKVSSSVTLTISISDVGDDSFESFPDQFSLHQNYPNPFNPSTTIAFNLSSKSSVELEVFDILGRQVNKFDFGVLSAGEHDYMYDASSLSSGIYFYRIVTNFGAKTRKMVLAK